MKYWFIILSIITSVNCHSQSEDILVEVEALRNNAKLGEALVKIDKILKKEENTKILLIKAEILFDLKQYKEVYQTYDRAIKLNPTDIKTLVQRGIFLIQYGKYKSGEADLNKALSTSEGTDEACYVFPRVGAVFGYLRQLEKSHELLVKAYNCDSTNLDVLVSLGAVCDELGKSDQAVTYLRKGLNLDSTNFMIHGNLGFILQEQEKYEEAVISFKKSLSYKPDEPQTLGNLAYNQYKLGHLDLAMKNINKSIELYPTNSYAYRTRAFIYLVKGENHKACENIETALAKGYTMLHGNDALDFQKENCTK
ncbi:MAG: hypothetical protein JKY08_10735 [Flavobacteriaceae bacterium]|nr:hypothetical protein [Flavobacteriaceae bacterium]